MGLDSDPPSDASDADLIKAVRSGDTEQYKHLYERHHTAARTLARQLAYSAAEADDFVAESFERVLVALKRGSGPTEAFRAYLFTTLRNVAYGRTRKDARLCLTGDIQTETGAVTEPATDPAVEEYERTLAARAFRRLPERWQMVLWHTVVEEEKASTVAPLLGVSAKAVHALAHRARERLKQEYLQAHVADAPAPECRAVAMKLGAWTRDALPQRDKERVDQHLKGCEDCRTLAAELADVNRSLRTVIPFLILGGGAAAYLTAVGVAAPVTAAAASTAAGGGPGSWLTPRNVLGGGVVAAAVAGLIALAVTGGDDEPPPSRAMTPPEVPTGSGPGAPAPESAPPPSTDSPTAPDEPATTSPSPSPTEEAPAPYRARPVINAETPGEGVVVAAGRGAQQLDVTVTNNGTAEAENTTVTLALPPGVRAVDQTPSGGGAAPAGGGGAPAGGAVVRCPGGEGTVTCESTRELVPGESVVMRFHIEADLDADPGEIKGTIDVGDSTPVTFTVPVIVETPPDVAHLAAEQVGLSRLLIVTVRNDGELARPASVTVDAPARTRRLGLGLDCDGGGAASVKCAQTEPLEPGETTTLRLWVHPWLDGIDWSDFTDPVDVVVTATVGDDTVSTTVRMECPLTGWLPKRDDDEREPASEGPDDGDVVARPQGRRPSVESVVVS